MVNPSFRGGRGLALTIRYRKDELPYLWQWRNFRERAYVMGMSLAMPTCVGVRTTASAARLPILETGERREYHLEVEAALGLA